jgi:hypothetical protein
LVIADKHATPFKPGRASLDVLGTSVGAALAAKELPIPAFVGFPFSLPSLFPEVIRRCLPTRAAFCREPRYASATQSMMSREQTMTVSIAAHMRRIAVCALFAAALSIAVPEARAADLLVRYDQSQLIRLPRPAADVIIGNPSIADVTIQGGNLLVVTGKTFGITNIIALDAQRNVIQDQRVLVEPDSQRSLVLYKGAKRESYTCTPVCAPTITIGDSNEFFDTTAKHAQRKTSVSAGLVERSEQQQSNQ